MSKEKNEKVDFALTDGKGKSFFLLKSMQTRGVLLKFPTLNKDKHITILANSNNLSFHITDEPKLDKTLKYPNRIEMDYSIINSEQFINAVTDIYLKHLQLYPIDKLPWRRYLQIGSLSSSEYNVKILTGKQRHSIHEYSVFVTNREGLLQSKELNIWFTLQRKGGASGGWYDDGVIFLDITKNFAYYLQHKAQKEIIENIAKLININLSGNAISIFRFSRSEIDALRRNFKLFSKKLHIKEGFHANK